VGGGIEHAADWIRSSNLGNHTEQRTGGYVDANGGLGVRTHATVGLRVDRYQRFGTAWAPSVGVGTWVSGTVRMRGSVNRSFRAPTFTERFYRDPAHEASPALVPEQAWAGDAAIDWVPHPQWMATATMFVRRERDVIDWVKPTVADRWRTRNIRRVDTRGVELSAKRALGTGTFVSVDYAFTDVAPGALTLVSKYTLDYARHSLGLTASGIAWRGMGAGVTLAARQRTGRDAYVLADVRLSRRVGRATVFVDVRNLFDQDYEEVRGIVMPGRWVTAGLRLGR
jgi:iron complex outermembrane receptor protein